VRSPWHETPRRRATWIALIVAVAFAHGLFGLGVAATVIGWQRAPEPKRIEVALMRRLEPTAPPAARPAPPPAAKPPAGRGRAAALPASSASAVEAAEAASAAAQAADLKARALALAAARAASDAAASAAASASASAPTALASASAPAASASGPAQPALDWPPSTRLTYTLTGLFRNGPLYGHAQVDWRRQDLHYQVEFNFSVEPFFEQRMFSDGQIGADGLEPRHYDETRKATLTPARRRALEFEDDEVVLANGDRVPRLPQSQDPASQFVQFVWMFSTHPEWLREGNVVGFPLALPNVLRTWQYRVGAVETLQLPFGPLDAVHLTPIIVNRRPNEYPFEIWTAPTLQYLPVRIRVLLDERNFAELTLDDKPLQARPSTSDSDVPDYLKP
jgi:hypothetical protein